MIARLAALAGVLVLTGGCDLFLGIPDLGDPHNVARMKARFAATIQAERHDPAPLDIWISNYMGPRAVAFCGRPSNVPATQRAYQINFFRGSFGGIGEIEVETPAHPPEPSSPDYCALRPRD